MAFRCSLVPTILTFCGLVVYGAASHADDATAPAGEETTPGSGYVFGAVYTGEIWKNTAGGIKRDAAYLDNLDLTAEIDAERAWGWDGATFFAYLVGNFAADPLTAEIVGDAQGVSNIDATSALRVLELWYEQNFWNDRLSVKTGLWDLNSEFDVIEAGGLFINSSHGIGVDFSQAGENGPSIFPVTSLAMRGRVTLTDTLSFQMVVLDGVPGDPNHPRRTTIRLGNGDGVLIAAEADYEDGAGTKLALGVWHFTARFDDVFATDAAGDPLRKSGNQGIYMLGERTIYHEPGDPDQGLAVYGRLGFADSDVNQFSNYIGAGAVYTGLLPGRGEDQLGLALAIARNGGPFKDALRAGGGRVFDQEFNIELTYRAQVTPWLALQPDIQYILDPGAGANGDLDNALVVGLRFELNPF